MQTHAVGNTVVATFSDLQHLHWTLNWAQHLHRAGVRGLLVGIFNVNPASTPFQNAARQLREFGAIAYAVLSRAARLSPQGGRWFHVMPLLLTGARVLLSDSDVVWLRDPRPYMKRLEAAHPTMDMAFSTDAEGPTDRRPLLSGSPRALNADATDLDVEAYSACKASLNIGIIHFSPGARPGTLRAVSEMVAHLRLPGNLRRVDQGPLNYRLKSGANQWRWQWPLHVVPDASGNRLCALANGTVTAGVLPIAQFGNLLTHQVLQLSRAVRVRPFSLHATFARVQQEAYKLARLREAGVWLRDPPAY